MADFRRKFTDAARRYIQLSYEPEIHTDERMASLKRAIICTILSSAGNRREREREREREEGGNMQTGQQLFVCLHASVDSFTTMRVCSGIKKNITLLHWREGGREREK